MSMSVQAVNETLAGLGRAGVSVACFLPDSLMKELYAALRAAPDIRTIPVTNEGEGAAICAGVWLSGKRAVLVMENSGIRAAAEPLARLGLGARIPVVMIMSFRGDLGEPNWWAIPHGITMEPMLNALRIPYTVVRHVQDIGPSIERAFVSAHASMNHAAVVLAGECTDYQLVESAPGPVLRPGGPGAPLARPGEPRGMRRLDCMKALGARLKDELVILSLGGSVDEWDHAAPHMREASLFQQQLGCVTTEAFGLATGLPHRRVIALDTDGGMLFNLGILATLANERPRNLIVIVWDNECYLSIGGPPTHTAEGIVDIAAVARGAGIEHAVTVRTLDEFDRCCAEALAGDDLYLISAKVAPVVAAGVPRKHGDGIEYKYIFARHVERTEGTTIIGPSEHN
jgi:sulfopyruvate decarboxylase subunit beta